MSVVLTLRNQLLRLIKRFKKPFMVMP